MRFYGNTQAHVLDNYKSGSFADALANRVLVVKEGYVYLEGGRTAIVSG